MTSKDADPSKLLADIEEFSINGPKPSAEPAKPELHRETLAFPDLSTAAPGRAAIPAAGSAGTAGKEQPALEAPSTLGAANGNSLLARLKKEAQNLQQDTGQRGANNEARAARLSVSLGAAIHYLDDLVKQLNIIKPPIPREFVFPGNIVFKEMSWVDGGVDFRMVPSASEDKRYESLFLRLRIAAPRQLIVDRDNIGVEPLRKQLHDYNVTFSMEEKFNARRQLESARFLIPCEIKAGFIIKADYEAGTHLLRTRNIDRFGMMEFRLQAEELNQEALDELTHLMLGAESRFLKMFRRTA